MAKSQPFALIYDPEVGDHLNAIELKFHSLIRATIEEQLSFEAQRHSRKLRAILDAADRRIDQGAGMRHDDFWREAESKNRRRERKGK